MEQPRSPTPLRRRVLIADDSPLVRRELRSLLSLSSGLEIVGEAADGLEAVRLAVRLRPEVVVMDLGMPVMDGYVATRWIKRCQPLCRIVVLTVHEDEAERQRAAQAGADVFLTKGAPFSDIVQAIFG